MKHYKPVEFLSILGVSSPPTENFLATVLSLLLIHLLSTRNRIFPKWNKNLNAKCAVAWPAQNCGCVKMFDFRRTRVFVWDTAS